MEPIRLPYRVQNLLMSHPLPANVTHAQVWERYQAAPVVRMDIHVNDALVQNVPVRLIDIAGTQIHVTEVQHAEVGVAGGAIGEGVRATGAGQTDGE